MLARFHIPLHGDPVFSLFLLTNHAVLRPPFELSREFSSQCPSVLLAVLNRLEALNRDI